MGERTQSEIERGEGNERVGEREGERESRYGYMC